MCIYGSSLLGQLKLSVSVFNQCTIVLFLFYCEVLLTIKIATIIFIPPTCAIDNIQLVFVINSPNSLVERVTILPSIFIHNNVHKLTSRAQVYTAVVVWVILPITVYVYTTLIVVYMYIN